MSWSMVGRENGQAGIADVAAEVLEAAEPSFHVKESCADGFQVDTVDPGVSGRANLEHDPRSDDSLFLGREELGLIGGVGDGNEGDNADERGWQPFDEEQQSSLAGASARW